MNIIDKIDKYLNEKTEVRKFSNVKELADFIMKMETKVKSSSKKKFEDQMKRSIEKFDIDGMKDPKATMLQMSFKEVKTLYSTLLGLSYENLDA